MVRIFSLCSRMPGPQHKLVSQHSDRCGSAFSEECSLNHIDKSASYVADIAQSSVLVLQEPEASQHESK